MHRWWQNFIITKVLKFFTFIWYITRIFKAWNCWVKFVHASWLNKCNFCCMFNQHSLRSNASHVNSVTSVMHLWRCFLCDHVMQLLLHMELLLLVTNAIILIRIEKKLSRILDYLCVYILITIGKLG